MKRILIFFLLALFAIPQQLFAVSLDDFDPDFILSDEELTYWQSMDLEAIERFLDSKNGYIADLVTTDTDGARKTAAQIIFDTAKKYKINPKYLIVKLQKEQSLVTTKNPTQKQLDWATGYGVCDSCSMDDPKIQKFRGFGNQVDYAAGIMRWYYDNVDSQSFIKRPGTSYTISGELVRPLTLATGFLYTYTPHVLGNRNFWYLWNTWFESRYPNGTLIKGDASPEIYLLQDGEKRLFDNYTALITRFNPDLIVTVPEAELADYATGPAISLPNFAVLKEGTRYYLLDYDTLRPFKSEAVVRDLGYNPAEIIDVTKSDIAGYTLGSTITSGNSNPLGELVYIAAIDTHYYIKDGMYHAVLDPRIVPINYPHLSPKTVEPDYFTTQDLSQGEPVTIKDGVIFGVEGYNMIYVMENGKKRHIANEAVFEGLGYKWDNIKWVSRFTGPTIPDGTPLDSAPNRAPDTTDAAEFDSSNVDTNAIAGSSDDTATLVETNQDDRLSYFVRTPVDEVTYTGPQFNTDIESYLVYDVAAEEIIAGKNIDAVRQPASLQKVLTVLLLDQKGLNTRAITTYDPTKHNALYHRYRVVAGEQIRNENLLDAFLVSSLNTPGRMLVDKTVADETAFIADMNKLVSSWGLTNTHVVDVTGERVANETTARDYLTIFKQAIENDLVNTYLSKRSYTYTAVLDKDGNPDHSDVHTNALVRRAGKPYTILASKTGFLWESGGNLAMHVFRDSDKKEFIIIALGNPDFDDRYSAPDLLADWVMSTF